MRALQAYQCARRLSEGGDGRLSGYATGPATLALALSLRWGTASTPAE
jgi:hypothetical protein